MIDHNIKNYDIHHKCLALAECEPEMKFEVTPSTDENYISLSVGVFLENFESETGQQVPIVEYIRLINSFSFMPKSHESLVADLLDSRFDILRSKYESYSSSDFQLLCQKGFYCYSYKAMKSLAAKPTTIMLKQCFQNLVVKTSATTTTFI